MRKKFYLAYGANLNLTEMSYRCPRAEPLRSVHLQGWQLEFCRHATIEQRPGARMQGALWLITEECEARLDRFEGFPTYYRKQTLTVFNRPTLVYLINDNRLSAPSASYYQTLEEGYKDWNLDTYYLEQAALRAEAPVSYTRKDWHYG